MVEIFDITSRVSEAQRPVDIAFAAEWKRQVGTYVRLGFHDELVMSEEEYRSSLSQFGPQPQGFAGRFDIPVPVDPRISPARQVELAAEHSDEFPEFKGFTYSIHEKFEVSDFKHDVGRYKTPSAPYTTWMQIGEENRDENIRGFRTQISISRDERGATIQDGIALVITNAPLLQGQVLLPGTTVEYQGVPLLTRGVAGFDVRYSHLDAKLRGVRIATCGRAA